MTTDPLPSVPTPTLPKDSILGKKLDTYEAAAKEQAEKNTYTWFSPEHVLWLVTQVRTWANRSDYYQAQLDALLDGEPRV